MSSLMNLMEMVGEGEGPPPPHPQLNTQTNAFPPPPPPAPQQQEKGGVVVEDEFTELFRDLRENGNMSRDEESRCIIRTISVLLQLVVETRNHVRDVNERLDEMASNTKDLRQRTAEVLATVEKENCLNIPQSAIKAEVRRVIETYGTLFPDPKQIQEIATRLCAESPSLKTITKMSSLVKNRLVKERHELSTKVKGLDHLPLEDVLKTVFGGPMECSMENLAVILIVILREFFRHDEEDQSRMLKESNTTSPPQYAEYMKNKLKEDGEMKRKVFDLANEIGVGKRPR
eukprot:CAMPEP_0201493184 /NCGR_PEP_ID=MMETSP0151_2-20130828/36263_1 /ASSEMBLY_ACC=CAM_ASM_000257 /TAXON_ID=200890 /ORGANISM="Paramoeba atlantica, Strain 621/1 / CCAP 1560/9" /LENGTH=287 /DNA_ID=CAMNT_0047880387 /DNA_START=88 /DNA_END=947 /DNA_ORIENTATION=-